MPFRNRSEQEIDLALPSSVRRLVDAIDGRLPGAGNDMAEPHRQRPHRSALRAQALLDHARARLHLMRASEFGS
jgi:hypothetical protein